MRHRQSSVPARTAPLCHHSGEKRPPCCPVGHDPKHIATPSTIAATSRSSRCALFPMLHLESDLATALAASQKYLWWWCQAMFSATTCCGRLNADASGCASGMGDQRSKRKRGALLLQDVAREALGDQPAGGDFRSDVAKELAAGFADGKSRRPQPMRPCRRSPATAAAMRKSFRAYINSDFIGVQLGGAVKNVIAIGAGMSDIGFGANARTALITRGPTGNVAAWRSAWCRPATFYARGWRA